MIRVRDLAWLAGLLEGEGSFGLVEKNCCSPWIKLGMTDEDVVSRAAEILRYKNKIYAYQSLKNKEPYGKVVYVLRISGAPAVEWMQTLYPFFGKRRRAKIREVLQKWKAVPLGWLTDGERKKITSLFKAGKTAKDIAEEFSISKVTVYNTVRRASV